MPRIPVTADADEIACPQGRSRDAVLVPVHHALWAAICDPLQNLGLRLVKRSPIHGPSLACIYLDAPVQRSTSTDVEAVGA